MLDFASISLDANRPELLYYQLAKELERLILSGTSPHGTVLPSACKLGNLLHVNRVTVLKAYGVLAGKHLVEHASARRFRICLPSRSKVLKPYATIGIVLPCSFSFLVKNGQDFTQQYIAGIIDAVSDMKLSATMVSLPAADASQNDIQAYLEQLTQGLDGVIHIGDRNLPSDPPLEQLMHCEQLPQVVIDAIPTCPNIGMILCDASLGIAALAEQLIALNHREVGLISYQNTNTQHQVTYASQKRMGTVRSVLASHGLSCPARYEVAIPYNPIDRHEFKGLAPDLEAMSRTGDMPTVFFCQNDELALHVIKTLRHLGHDVPAEISVVGYDGLNQALEQGLTTICQPFYAIGRQAVTSLVDYIQNGIDEQNRTSTLLPYLYSNQTLAQAKGTGAFLV